MFVVVYWGTETLDESVRTEDFDYELPLDLIAQTPCAQRDQSRLLVLNRATAARTHHAFADLLQFLRPGDIIVLNDSKVLPARLRGLNTRTEGEFEILLLEENARNDWWAMIRPGKRARLGTEIRFKDRHGAITSFKAIVTEANAEGHRRLRWEGTDDVLQHLDELGEVPLPPYIKREGNRSLEEDWARYQTVYGQNRGSMAAPTAGLHFTARLLNEIRQMGVQICTVTLHVGLGTFAPVKTSVIAEHPMHEEAFSVPAETATAIAEGKACGRRVIAVGTTTTRVLETVARENAGRIVPVRGRTRIFIYPPQVFQVVDALVTNFHLPCSTLLMLVSAFAAPGCKNGRDLILDTYAEAIRERYRFFSYGDAMLLL